MSGRRFAAGFISALIAGAATVHADPRAIESDHRDGDPTGVASPATHSSITDTSFELPSWKMVWHVLTLRDHNTRVVVLGTSGLGLAAGVIGSFMLLRKRALLGDALSHATLPGIGIAFIVMTMLGGSGKWLPGLLMGATVFGVIGVVCILLIVHLTRIKEDAALGIVLSVFFGLGVAVLGVIQNMGTGSAAGLESFIYGKTASMLTSDAWLILSAAGVVALVAFALFRELKLLCFDQDYAASLGRPVVLLDAVMMGLVVAVTVIGLQSVGLILMVALLIIPPAAARFWTNHLPTMVLAAAVVGAGSGLLGAAISALTPRLPAGAIIVVVAGLFFVVSMVFGSARGIVVRLRQQRSLKRKVASQHLLRAMYELSEADGTTEGRAVLFAELLALRSWSALLLRRALVAARRDGWIEIVGGNAFRLTEEGERAARRVVRNHRLWELYLITHADIAPSHVDRDADEVEHVLSGEMISELEALMRGQYPEVVTPPSPHVIRV